MLDCGKIFALFFACLLSAPAGFAHGIVGVGTLPHHIFVSAHSLHAGTGLSKVPISGSARLFQQTVKNLSLTGFGVGQQHLLNTGGIVTGGTLNGTIYANGTIGGSNTFLSQGTYQAVFGSAATPGNSLIFGKPNLSPVIVRSIAGIPLSGARSAQLSQYATVAHGAISLGETGGALQGGIFFGTFFGSANGSSYTGTSNFFIAFGNNPFNNGSFNTSVTVPNQIGSIIFKSGKIGTISSGLLSPFKFSGTSLFSSSPFNAFALAASPFNTHAPSVFFLPKVNTLIF
jgi:hypothetical protein